MYRTFDDFWEYYIAEIEKQVPADLWKSFLEVQEETKKTKDKKPEKWTPAETHAYMVKHQLTDFIHNSLKKLTDQQVGELNYYIRTIVKFPKKIALIYTPKLNTYASWYNVSKKQFEILYPTITIFMKKFPESLKAGIMHELGHIINGDCLVKKNVLHSQCTNIAMDARINMHLDYQMLDYLTRCLVFENETGYFVKPEDYYPSIGLPVTPGGYSWDFAHEQYHFFDDLNPKKPNLPKSGSGKQLTQEEAEEIMGTLSPEQIKEMQEGEGDGEEQEGDGEGEGQEGQGKQGKPGKGKGKGKGQGQEGEEGDEDGEGSGGGEKEGDKKGKGKSGQGKQGGGEPGDGEPGGGEGDQGEEKEGKGKDGSGKPGEGKDGEKGKKPGEGGEKTGEKGGEEGDGKSKTSGGDDPTKNSRKNKGLTKNIDKTIAMLGKIKEKYAA